MVDGGDNSKAKIFLYMYTEQKEANLGEIQILE